MPTSAIATRRAEVGDDLDRRGVIGIQQMPDGRGDHPFLVVGRQEDADRRIGSRRGLRMQSLAELLSLALTAGTEAVEENTEQREQCDDDKEGPGGILEETHDREGPIDITG